MAQESPRKQKVVIVGAGPVGSLAAIYAAARGDDVEVYELRGDLRDPSTIPLNFTKSINLALSERGISALKGSNRDGMVEKILNDAIPMHGRMIHGRDDGRLWEAAQVYDVHGQAINSVDRSTLNNVLLDELERTPNVKLFFNHKLTGADFHSNKAWFERRAPGDTPLPGTSNRVPEIQVSFDYLIGADGAHSASRYHMMKYSRVDYQQEYIDTLWCEFRIPPSETGDFRISPNHLHIWPGKEFMFIALPSPDKSFTCTLFAPAAHYAQLESSPQKLFESFDANFPGVSDLIPAEALQEQFKENPHLPLISLKCNPHHYGSNVVIVGDAAHAILPFYGQGLNAGLEDIRVLFEFLDQHDAYDLHAGLEARRESRLAAFQAYTTQRTMDAHAINDLSKQNYIEMRWGVNTPLYKIRKSVEETLDLYVPSLGWKTQYARVSFSTQRYSDIVKAVRRQGRILGYGLASAVISSIAVAGVLAWRTPGRFSPLSMLQSTIRFLGEAWTKVFPLGPS
ncbi:kynurenine 3-monooxygenase [Aspergillus coremiiformis]|uniref:Kynurenine 3-monooxygenase n=1 Tax=Aspergillus coremiiformis TaxID=138285 RepID=A0A5N6Z8J4_9EURO|nr:kynurenine 3-monooxygenase [Aspergillus coremiiformis]